jgi:uncharacterized membrane protein
VRRRLRRPANRHSTLPNPSAAARRWAPGISGLTLAPLVFVLVAGSALLHITWNILLKTAGDPLRAAAIGMATSSLVFCPTVLVAWVLVGQPAVAPKTIALGLASGLLQTVYFASLAAAYRRGDLSVVYPLARGSAPLIAVLIGVTLLGERLQPVGWAGVALLLVGMLLLGRPWRHLRASGREGNGAAWFALLTGVAIAGYSAVDLVGVRGTQPWMYAGIIWGTGTAFLMAYVWFHRQVQGRLPGRAAKHPAFVDATEVAVPVATRRAAVGGLITLLAYGLILVAFSVAPLTAVAPLRESAIVLAATWGAFRLGETSGQLDSFRRVACAGLIVVGAILLAIEPR